MKSALLALLASSCASLFTPAVSGDEREVVYEVDLSRAHTQYVDLATRLPTEGRESCELSLPTWRPGRYTILDPAGTVFDVRAEDETGNALPIAKTAKSTWRVECANTSEVVVRYAVYANSLYDRTRHVDGTHAFLSGSSVFLFSPPLRSAPARVEIRAPEGWGVATGLEPAGGDPRVRVAASYDVLVDSPLEIGLHDRVDFDVDGVPHELAIWPPGIEVEPERLIEDITKIVEAQTAVFGRVPYERYVFLVHGKRGAGATEHLNSTIIQTSRVSLEGSVGANDAYSRFLGLVSHETFHTWNVKQLRPAGIHPYDYLRENHTDLLWVAEGTTSYYERLTLARTGQRKVKKHLEGIAREVDSLRRLPAARVTSLAEASWNTWIQPSDPNGPNTLVDYYDQGALASLCLDLELRRRTANAASLDTVMRAMFERFPLEGPGYRTADLLAVLEEIAGSSFESFFERFIAGTEPLPFEEVLPTVGLELTFVPAKDEDDTDEDDETDTSNDEIPQKPYLGLRLRSGGTGSVIRNLLADGPAFDSGLLAGDEILFLNGRRLRPGDLDERLKKHEPGDRVTLHVLRDDELHVVDVTLTGIPDGKYELRRLEDTTEVQRAAYASWIGQPWPEETPKESAETASGG